VVWISFEIHFVHSLLKEHGAVCPPPLSHLALRKGIKTRIVLVHSGPLDPGTCGFNFQAVQGKSFLSSSKTMKHDFFNYSTNCKFLMVLGMQLTYACSQLNLLSAKKVIH